MIMKFYIMKFIGIDIAVEMCDIPHDKKELLVMDSIKHSMNGVDVSDYVFNVQHSIRDYKERGIIQYRSFDSMQIDDKLHNRILLLNSDYHTNTDKSSNLRRWRMSNSWFSLIIDEHFSAETDDG